MKTEGGPTLNPVAHCDLMLIKKKTPTPNCSNMLAVTMWPQKSNKIKTLLENEGSSPNRAVKSLMERHGVGEGWCKLAKFWNHSSQTQFGTWQPTEDFLGRLPWHLMGGRWRETFWNVPLRPEALCMLPGDGVTPSSGSTWTVKNKKLSRLKWHGVSTLFSLYVSGKNTASLTKTKSPVNCQEVNHN